MYSTLHGKPLWTKQPLAIQFDTINFCNLNCIYCNPQAKYVKDAKKLSTRKFKYVLDYVKRKGWLISYVYLYMNGDPLFEDRLHFFAKLVKDILGCKVVVFTNGTNYSNRELLRDKNIDEVRFTISAATPEIYAKVHGKELWLQAFKTAHWLRKNKYWNQRIFVNYILCKENEQELQEWKKQFADFELDIRPLHDSATQTQSGQAGDTGRFDLATNKNLNKKVYSGKRPCPCFSSLQISYDGNLMHCCDADYQFNYGDVLDRDIEEMWQEKLKAGVTCEACRGCTIKGTNHKEIFKKYVWNKQ